MPFDFAPHAARLMETFGVAATYTPPSESPVACRAHVERDVVFAPTGFETTVSEPHVVVTLRVVEVGVPVVGATLTVGTESWTLARLIGNDGYLARAILQ